MAYAIALGWPKQALLITSFGTVAATHPGRVTYVELLGSTAKIRWQQTVQGLRIELPEQKPATDEAGVFKLSMA